MQSNKFYCPRIQNGISFNYDGTLDVCAARRKIVSGKADDDALGNYSLQEFMHSTHRKSLVAAEKNNTWPMGCEACKNDELMGKTSLRQSLLQHMNHVRYLHISMSNICDSDCIMCGPAWSSKIAARLTKHPDPNHVYLGKDQKSRRWWQNANARKSMLDAADWADHIHVLGGEPVVDPDLWQFLEQIASPGKSLSFVTNLNNLPNEHRLLIMSKFKKVSMLVSIDAVGITHEWIRQGVSWRSMLRNMIVMREAGVHLNVHCTVQAHGMQDLAKHHELFTRTRLSPSYELLKAPSLLSICNAPIKVLERAITDLEAARAQPNLLADLSQCLGKHDASKLTALIAHTDYLNGHRQHKFNTYTWQVETR